MTSLRNRLLNGQFSLRKILSVVETQPPISEVVSLPAPATKLYTVNTYRGFVASKKMQRLEFSADVRYAVLFDNWDKADQFGKAIQRSLGQHQYYAVMTANQTVN